MSESPFGTSHPPLAARARSAAFIAGVAIFVISFALGAYESIVVNGQLPRLGLNYNWWFKLLEERGDREAIRDQWAMAAVVDHGNRAVALTHLADELRAEGQLDEAIRYYRRSLALRPTSAPARNNLANALAERGEIEAAILEMREATRLNPGLDAAQQNLEALLEFQQQRRLAGQQQIDQLRDQLAASPGNQDLRNNLAWLLATPPDPALRNPAAALALAGEVVQASARQDPAALDTLAVAWASLRRFEQAAAVAREALALTEASGNEGLSAEIADHLAAFERGAPIKSSPR